jgi:LAO/AO transport system kinase
MNPFTKHVEFAAQSEIALSISTGKSKDDTSSVNPNIRKMRKTRKTLSNQELYEGIIYGNRMLLARAITLIESQHADHRQQAQDLIQMCMPHTGNSLRIGITGVPGVGKSSFLESFGTWLDAEQGRKLAVLAIDPSSKRSGGSILGDKTRMEYLSRSANAFIRPSPSAGSLGGVAQKTRESILLCEAAGFDTIFIETVGVGQSEITVHGMVDFFLLLMLAGAGDELQGIKRGIMEMADGMAITKADGDNIQKSKLAKQSYANALHLFPANPYGWVPEVKTCSAMNKTGMQDIWDMILRFEKKLKDGGHWDAKRKDQIRSWMQDSILQYLQDDFYNHAAVQSHLPSIETSVMQGQESPFQAAQRLLQFYLHG